MSQQIRVVIGDDHPLFCSGAQALLETKYKVVGTAANGRELVGTALQLKPEVVVLDVSMPELNGFEAARQIRAALPSTKLVFLSMHSNPRYLTKALEYGNAYVVKTGATDELLLAVRTVLAGGRYVSPSFGSNIEATLLTSAGQQAQIGALTGRQIEVLQLVAEGKASKEIAHILHISARTVDFHRAQIMARVGARSAAELVRMAVEEGLLPAATSGVA